MAPQDRLVYLIEWILPTLQKKLTNSHFTSRCAAKHFVRFRSPEDANVDFCPVLRLLRFCKSENGSLSAVFHDESHKILAVLAKECIRRFECAEAQRITYLTNDTLFVVKDADLEFLHVTEITRLFGHVPSLSVSASVDCCFLVIHELEWFVRWPIDAPARYDLALPWIYGDSDYIDHVNGSRDTDLAQLDVYYTGGMVSD